MYGAGVPVCAIHYEPALKELVQHKSNGIIFQNHADLSMHIKRLLFENSADEISTVGSIELTNLRFKILSEIKSWEENWNEIMKPFVLTMVANRKSMKLSLRICFAIGVFCATVVAYSKNKY
jgi:hypothetical protein